MGTITINVQDEIEKEFRETVKKHMGQGKGVLGKAIETALQSWTDEEKQKKIAERQLKLMKEGLYSLKGWKFNRVELHER